MFYEFSLRNVLRLLFILFVTGQIPATAIADPVPQSTDEPFGLSAAAAPDDEFTVLRRSVETGILFDHGTLVRCQANEDCPPAAQQFLEIVAQGHKLTGRTQIGVINRAINLAIRPARDKAEMSVSDSWDSPLDSLAAAQGDCKNYAVAKYLALLEVGISAADVRLVIVRDRVVDQNHAVITVRLDQHWLVLDNRWLALAEDTELPRFEPLAVLELDGVEQHPAVLATLLTPLHFPLPQRD